MHVRYVCVVMALAFMTGCSSLGPLTLPRDRFDYSSALAESWKYQTLLNIVKLRYMDLPIFIDVAQVVSGYQLTATLNAGGQFNPSSTLLGNTATLGASGQFTDRPTITYTPLTGDDYVRGLMTPLRPETVFFAILAGNPADGIFFTSVESVNGLKNQRFGALNEEPADPGFLRLIGLMRKLQTSGALRFRIKETKEKGTSNLLFFRKESLTQEETANILEIKALLNLDPASQEFQLVFGPSAESNREIALQTRSLIQIMLEVSAQVDVPEAHVAEGRATRGIVEQSDGQNNIRTMRIHCSEKKSEYAFLSIWYRDRYFWIDDRDIRTKQRFAYLMYLFSLAEKGVKQPLPLITIPAQ